MFDAFFRALKDRLLGPLARRLGRRVSPNVVSLVAFVFGLTAAGLAARRAYAPALACWLTNRVVDGFDGTLARATNAQTDFGGYLDILLDFTVYAAVPLGLIAGVPTMRNAWAGLALLASYFVNAASWMYLAAILEQRGQGAKARGERTTVTMPPGIVAGAETVLFFSLFLLLPARLATLFTLMAVGVGVNILQRLAWAARTLR